MLSVPLRCRYALIALAVSACAPAPVDWAAERTVVAGDDSALVLQPDGGLTPDTMAALRGRMSRPAGPACPGSLRVASVRGTQHAVWWAPRSDSTARLMAAHSADVGRVWSTPVSVDTTDVGVTGCRREPPAIAADSASGYVHVTYALQAREGPGLFFSHSMDGGASFHAPVPILYGERLGRTSVAVDGDLVVVGFEDPNSITPRIGLAISHTMGHIFEDRIVPVSDDHGIASNPLTAVRGRRVAVAWEQRGNENAPAAMAVRAGLLR
ncbi:MAG: glycoside hydrolase [Gemmatimonadota bacterium]|nr:glycoside hydrolase [Gemmatimonadota bacterium]